MKKLLVTAAVLIGAAVSTKSAQAQIAYYNPKPLNQYSAEGSLSYGYYGPLVGIQATCYNSENTVIYTDEQSFGTCAYGIEYSDYANGDGFGTLRSGGAGYNSYTVDPNETIIDDWQNSIDCDTLQWVTDYSDSYHGCWPNE